MKRHELRNPRCHATRTSPRTRQTIRQAKTCHFSAVVKSSLQHGRLRGPTTITRRVPESNRGPQIRFSHLNQYDGWAMKCSGIKMYIYWILEKIVPRTKRNETRAKYWEACADRGGRCAVVVRDAMRGPLRAGYRCGRRAARCADCLRCDAMRAGWLHSRGALWCTGDARADALRTGCDAMRCAGGLVAFARCRRHHAF